MRGEKTKKNHFKKAFTVIIIISILISGCLPTLSMADGNGDMYTEYTCSGEK